MDTNIEVALALRVKMHVKDGVYTVTGYRNDITIKENDSEEKVLPDDVQLDLVNACAKAVADVMLGAVGIPRLDDWKPKDI